VCRYRARWWGSPGEGGLGERDLGRVGNLSEVGNKRRVVEKGVTIIYDQRCLMRVCRGLREGRENVGCSTSVSQFGRRGAVLSLGLGAPGKEGVFFTLSGRGQNDAEGL